MAYTATLVKKTVFGDCRVHMYDVTADAATQAIDTGLETVYQCQITPNSMTALVQVDKNVNASGVSYPGYVAISGATSGDEFFLLVYGR